MLAQGREELRLVNVGRGVVGDRVAAGLQRHARSGGGGAGWRPRSRHTPLARRLGGTGRIRRLAL